MELLNGDVKLQRWKGGWFRIFTSLKYFRRQFFCGKYFGGLCMLSASDRKEAAQIFEIEDILSEYLLTFFWNI